MADTQYSGSPQAGDLLFTPRASFEPYFTHIADSSPSISITPGYGNENDNESDFMGPGHNKEVPGLLGVKNFSFMHPRSNFVVPVDYATSRSPSVASDQRSEDMGDTPTRFLVIGNLPRVAPHKIFAFFQGAGEVQDFDSRKLETQGLCLVSFKDVRDATTTRTAVREEDSYIIHFCSEQFFRKLLDQHKNSLAGCALTQIRCSVISGFMAQNITSVLYNALSTFGKISQISAEPNKLHTFVIAFMDTQDASELVDTLDGQYINGLRLKVELIEDEQALLRGLQNLLLAESKNKTSSGAGIWSPKPVSVSRGIPKSLTTANPWDTHNGTANETATSSASASFNSQNWRATSLPVDIERFTSGRRIGVRYEDEESSERNSATPGYERASSLQPIPGKNIIDLERIARGSDTRTTVMLRNIPNKVDQETLKNYIDETSRGLYNFLYLRIDFRNICNVGYAFINFADPLDIVDFVKAKSGTRWYMDASNRLCVRGADASPRNKFNSEKILDVTYANIQGVDQLVEKFRNSSVMDQDPAYRPKLFHTSGPLAGTEMEFPLANNILKKCRSISAAQQIGIMSSSRATRAMKDLNNLL